MSPAVVAAPRVPATRPRGRIAFAVPLLIAPALGLAVGLAPRPTFLVVSGVVVAAVLSFHLEWAAAVVVGSAVFASYLDRIWPHSVELLAVVLLVAWLLRRARGPVGRDRSVAAVTSALVFAAVLLLALAAHPLGRPGVGVVLRYAELLALFLVLVDCLAGPVRHDRLVRVYVWSCVAASLCGLVTAVVDARHRVQGPLANPDELAIFLLAAVPLAGLVPTSRRWHRTAMIAVLVLGTLGTQSQGALVGEVAILALAVAIRVLSLRAATLWLVLIGTVAALVLAVVPREVGTRFSDQQRFVETRVSERLTTWQAAASMTAHHPVLGLGPGAFGLFHEDYQRGHGQPRERDLDVAHSTVLQASSELGVLGALTLMGLYVVPILDVRRRRTRGRSRLAVAVGVSLVGVLVTSLFETEQYLLPLWFLAALASPVGAHWQGLPIGGRTVIPDAADA